MKVANLRIIFLILICEFSYINCFSHEKFDLKECYLKIVRSIFTNKKHTDYSQDKYSEAKNKFKSILDNNKHIDKHDLDSDEELLALIKAVSDYYGNSGLEIDKIFTSIINQKGISKPIKKFKKNKDVESFKKIIDELYSLAYTPEHNRIKQFFSIRDDVHKWLESNQLSENLIELLQQTGLIDSQQKLTQFKLWKKENYKFDRKVLILATDAVLLEFFGGGYVPNMKILNSMKLPSKLLKNRKKYNEINSLIPEINSIATVDKVYSAIQDTYNYYMLALIASGAYTNFPKISSIAKALFSNENMENKKKRKRLLQIQIEGYQERQEGKMPTSEMIEEWKEELLEENPDN